MEDIIYFVISMVVFMFSLYRQTFIKGLADDWNAELTIYIQKLNNNPAVLPQTIAWMEKYKINKWHYYFRLDVWSIKKIINDPFLIQEIHRQIQDKYIIR